MHATYTGTQLAFAESYRRENPRTRLVTIDLDDGFDAWKAPALAAGGDTRAAGLRIALPTGGCDIHPSPKGRDLLAQAIVDTIAASCQSSVTGCLDRSRP